jgi:hypothetical protein
MKVYRCRRESAMQRDTKEIPAARYGTVGIMNQSGSQIRRTGGTVPMEDKGPRRPHLRWHA